MAAPAAARRTAEDVLVYQDDDERFNLGAGRTRDGKFLVLESASHTTTESWVLPAAEPEGAFTLIAPREDEHEYSIDHRNGLWFIRTNDRGRNFRLVTAPVATPGREHWTELIPHRDNVMLEDVDLFAGFFVACEREDGLPRLRIWRFAGDGPEADARRRNRLSRAGLQRPSAHQPHLRHNDLPLRLPIPGHAQFGLRVRPGHRRLHAAQAA